MKIHSMVVQGRTITHCYHSCPYFGLDGGPGPVMVCLHPSIGPMEDATIISHPECDTGFPEKCPLVLERLR